MLAKFEEINIVQGDTFQADIVFTGLETDQVVQKVVFSSNFLGICKELQGSGNNWELELTSQETEGFRVGEGTFDVTIMTNAGARVTVIHNSPVKILPKTNRCKQFMGKIVIDLKSKQQIGASIGGSQYDIDLKAKQQIGVDLQTQPVEVDLSKPKLAVDMSSAVKTMVMPYSHDQLDNLDYESSGHTGFVPARLSLLPPTTGFRQGASVYADDGKQGFRMSITALKELNTKIVSTSDVGNVDMSQLTVGDFIYERKQ